MTTLSQITPAIVDTVLPEGILFQPIRLGSYQIDVLTGRRRLSGADLSGEARRWSVHYARSRDAALERVRALLCGTGVQLVEVRGPRGLRQLQWRIAGLTCAQWASAAQRPGLAGMVDDI